jgi:spermidine/putrescine transport system ATP-binding protein
VAGFLGISNLLSGTPDGGADSYAVIRLEAGASVRVPRASVSGTTPLRVGVRPEKIRLLATDATPPANLNQLPGTVRDASYMGVSTQYQVEIPGGTRVTVYEQNVERATKSELWLPGEQVVMAWSPDHSFIINDAAPATEPVA